MTKRPESRLPSPPAGHSTGTEAAPRASRCYGWHGQASRAERVAILDKGRAATSRLGGAGTLRGGFVLGACGRQPCAQIAADQLADAGGGQYGAKSRASDARRMQGFQVRGRFGRSTQWDKGARPPGPQLKLLAYLPFRERGDASRCIQCNPHPFAGKASCSTAMSCPSRGSTVPSPRLANRPFPAGPTPPTMFLGAGVAGAAKGALGCGCRR